jgi:hypothetical protein
MEGRALVRECNYRRGLPLFFNNQNVALDLQFGAHCFHVFVILPCIFSLVGCLLFLLQDEQA